MCQVLVGRVQNQRSDWQCWETIAKQRSRCTLLLPSIEEKMFEARNVCRVKQIALWHSWAMPTWWRGWSKTRPIICKSFRMSFRLELHRLKLCITLPSTSLSAESMRTLPSSCITTGSLMNVIFYIIFSSLTIYWLRISCFIYHLFIFDLLLPYQCSGSILHFKHLESFLYIVASTSWHKLRQAAAIGILTIRHSEHIPSDLSVSICWNSQATVRTKIENCSYLP